jgi:hypothetical protein
MSRLPEKRWYNRPQLQDILPRDAELVFGLRDAQEV